MAMSMGAAKRGKPRIVSRPVHAAADNRSAPPKRYVPLPTPCTNPQIGPDTSIKDTWAKLAAAIREIQNHNASRLSFEEHYRYAYNLVLFKRPSFHSIHMPR